MDPAKPKALVSHLPKGPTHRDVCSVSRNRSKDGQEGLLRELGRGGEGGQGSRREERGQHRRRRGGLDRLDRGGDGRGELHKLREREGCLQLRNAFQHFKLLQFSSHDVNIYIHEG